MRISGTTIWAIIDSQENCKIKPNNGVNDVNVNDVNDLNVNDVIM